jgi:hypothetical protein
MTSPWDTRADCQQLHSLMLDQAKWSEVIGSFVTDL